MRPLQVVSRPAMRLLYGAGGAVSQMRQAPFSCHVFNARRRSAVSAHIIRNAKEGSQRRGFITVSDVPTPLLPPLVFLGLLVALWTYKCTMAVIFQDKIIYMPYMPPFARSEQIEDYEADCRPVTWTTEMIRSLDGTRVALCIGAIARAPLPSDSRSTRVVICYLQGNGSSTPPRLPMLSNTMKAIYAGDELLATQQITLVVLSYRGYWLSSGRATEDGIRKDAQAMLRWISTTYGSDVRVLLWGQSIGAGVACAAAADAGVKSPQTQVVGMVLETPFSSIKQMLIALYPQKWLPYQYLWPFLWNHWDNEAALRAIKDNGISPRVLLLTAKRDEVVPPSESDKIEKALKSSGFKYDRVDIFGALHTEATTRREGQQAVARFVRSTLIQDAEKDA